MINISVLISTLNEAENLPSCLAAQEEFDEVIVIDSGSTDGTVEIAKSFGVRVANFNWNGDYPKKRQWCLDELKIKHDFVFFVDADEILTPELISEIKNLSFDATGYFVKGKYIWNDKTLRYGLKNNKLCLFNRHKIEFPVIDDLDIDGMGEIEGHYQPVLKPIYADQSIVQLTAGLHHNAFENPREWQARHERYAQWEAVMMARNAYPVDPLMWRQSLKTLFRKLPMRGVIAFCHSYFLKFGFLDGRSGFEFAASRLQYYNMVKNALIANKAQGKDCGLNKARSAP